MASNRGSEHPYLRWPDMRGNDVQTVRDALHLLSQPPESEDEAAYHEAWLNGMAAVDRMSWALQEWENEVSERKDKWP